MRIAGNDTRIGLWAWRGQLAALTLTVLIAAASAPDAAAMAQFSRLYKTSCATCHMVVPHLNSFGESFRRLGYHFPGDKDDEMRKVEGVEMGSEGVKQAYPQAIWPARIPGEVPVGFSVGHIFRYQRSVPGISPKPGQNLTFGLVGDFAEMQLAGTLDENYTFMGQYVLGTSGVSVLRSQFSVYDVFGADSGLNLKVGRFEPGVMEVSNFTRLTETGFLVLNPKLDQDKIVGDNTFSLELSQQGAELFGFLGDGGDTAYNLGVVEGRFAAPNAANNHKDVYLHVNHKFIGDGGLGYHMDGTPATTQPVKMKPGRNVWGDAESATVGGFVYSGATTLDAATRQLDDFRILGGDAVYVRDRLKLHGVYTVRQHDLPDLGKTFDRSANIWSAEADWAWFPWLVTAVRYETFDQDERAGDVTTRDFRRIVHALQYVPRANINVTLGMDVVDRSYETGGFDLDNVTLAFFIGF
ncbi:MAG: hypothetical protein HYY25_09670 [Candidatus Wallbacteria bacterium]|nr:hypothetical protein [Candidatus Wallbacteria bacterium]